MRRISTLLIVFILTGCETTPYQRGGVKLAPSVEKIILGKWGTRLVETRDVMLFRHGTTEYIAADVTVEHNIPDHWEGAWHGNILMRRIQAKSDWQMASEHLTIPNP